MNWAGQEDHRSWAITARHMKQVEPVEQVRQSGSSGQVVQASLSWVTADKPNRKENEAWSYQLVSESDD